MITLHIISDLKCDKFVINFANSKTYCFDLDARWVEQIEEIHMFLGICLSYLNLQAWIWIQSVKAHESFSWIPLNTSHQDNAAAISHMASPTPSKRKWKLFKRSPCRLCPTLLRRELDVGVNKSLNYFGS